MTANHSIDPALFLSEHLERAEPDLLRSMLRTFIQALMGAEADALCGAPYEESSDERVNVRNGYRPREWDTRAGTTEVAIPKLRSGSYFPDWLLERRRRAERALTTVIATCYLLGVSTRRMEKLVETLGTTRLSKSQVSNMAKELDEQVADFRSRPLDAGPYTFVAADALVLKVREGGRVVNVHALVATGVNADGHREILGLQVTSAEDGAGWLSSFRDLTGRGLSGVALVTSDAHSGLVAAIGATLPGASWQRCRTHYAANLKSCCPKASWPWGRTLLHSFCDQPDAKSVAAQYDRVLESLAVKLPEVTEHLEVNRADVLAFTAFPKEIWRQIWSINPGETQPGDPPQNRRGGDLPRPRLPDPPGRSRPGPLPQDPPDAATTDTSPHPRRPSVPKNPTRDGYVTPTGCVVCGKPLHGRADQRYFGHRCRQAAHRSRTNPPVKLPQLRRPHHRYRPDRGAYGLTCQHWQDHQ